jgi:hypothetical protein
MIVIPFDVSSPPFVLITQTEREILWNGMGAGFVKGVTFGTNMSVKNISISVASMPTPFRVYSM